MTREGKKKNSVGKHVVRVAGVHHIGTRGSMFLFLLISVDSY